MQGPLLLGSLPDVASALLAGRAHDDRRENGPRVVALAASWAILAGHEPPRRTRARLRHQGAAA